MKVLQWREFGEEEWIDYKDSSPYDIEEFELDTVYSYHYRVIEREEEN